MWPTEQELRDRLRLLFGTLSEPRSALVIEWQGRAFRFASRRYATRQTFTTGEGARRNGGRYTPQGGARTVYLGTSRETALAEMMAGQRESGLPDAAFQPRVLAAVAVCVGVLLDLTSTPTLELLGITPDQLLTQWKPDALAGRVAQVQVFGRLVYEAGFEGLLAPSARHPAGTNLALFPDNFESGSHCIMLDTDEPAN